MTAAAALLDAAIERSGGAAAVVQERVEPDRGTRRRLDFVMAHALSDDDEAFDDEIIEGTIGRGAMAVLYGDSNSGKTFAAIDMGASVARGVDWLGRPTAAGLVLYLATESPGSVQMRLRAYQRHHRLRVPGFVIVRSPVNLFEGDIDTRAIVELVAEIETEHGDKVALIIGDTLARIVVGANENSGEDMGLVVRNIDAIRAATGAAFVVIHHCGKDAAKGMRGWSGLRAATDTEIEVTVDEATGLRSAEITKQRDLPGKGDRLGFKLIPVAMGTNRWGNPRSSCVVESSDAPDKRRSKRQRAEIDGAVEEFLRARGTGCLKGALAKHFEGVYQRTSVYRALSRMVDGGELIEVGGVVALPGKPGAVA